LSGGSTLSRHVCRHAAAPVDALAESGHLQIVDWLRWRELRTRLAHEYLDQPELRFAVLKAAIGAAGEVVTAHARWKDRLGKA
jgi:uncharacterized protein with HEPN domain